MQTDLLIVGASTAGLMAAKRAAELVKQDFSITLIDKKKVIGVPPSPANTFFKSMWEKTGEQLKEEYILNRLDGMHIISPSLHEIEIKAPGFVIDRTKFDQQYSGQIEKLGVKILSAEARAVLKNGNKVAGVHSDLGEINAKLTIIADGVESVIAKNAGLRTMKYPEDIAWAYEVEVESNNIGEAKFFEYYIGSIAPGWKATYSPFGNGKAALGVYVRGRGRDVRMFYNAYLEKFKAIKKIRDLKLGEPSTGGDPIATIPYEIIENGVMVAGAACGQSGICYGMLAGKIAGETAAKALTAGNHSKQFLSPYEQEWSKALKSQYEIGRRALEAIRKMSDEEIDEIAEALEGEDISKYLKGSPSEIAFKLGSLLFSKSPGSILLLSRLMG